MYLFNKGFKINRGFGLFTDLVWVNGGKLFFKFSPYLSLILDDMFRYYFFIYDLFHIFPWFFHIFFTFIEFVKIVVSLRSVWFKKVFITFVVVFVFICIIFQKVFINLFFFLLKDFLILFLSCRTNFFFNLGLNSAFREDSPCNKFS